MVEHVIVRRAAGLSLTIDIRRTRVANITESTLAFDKPAFRTSGLYCAESAREDD
jgi:hypothetical protein